MPDEPDSRTDDRDPTYMLGDARTTTEPPRPSPPPKPAPQAGVQGQPAQAGEEAATPLICDHDCDDGCSMTEFPVWMRPYRCRHLSAAERRIRDIVFAESRDDDA